MALACQEAQRFNHEYIDTKHVLLGLIKEGSGNGVKVLRILGLDPKALYLELKNQIFSRKIGAYNLYFSRKTSFIPTITILSYCKALLAGIKINFPNKEQTFKEIGFNAAKKIKFAFGEDVFKKLKSLTEKPFSKQHLEALRDFYPSYDIFQPNVDISIVNIDPKDKKAIYRFKNSLFLDDMENHIYHIYLIAGITQGIFTNAYGIPIECKIEKINITNKLENSYFDLSLQIKGNI